MQKIYASAFTRLCKKGDRKGRRYGINQSVNVGCRKLSGIAIYDKTDLYSRIGCSVTLLVFADYNNIPRDCFVRIALKTKLYIRS